MTPKEKAKQLFNKYATYVVMWSGDINTTHENCKQCALITVDEIMNIKSVYHDDKLSDYWQEVKTEIQNL